MKIGPSKAKGTDGGPAGIIVRMNPGTCFGVDMKRTLRKIETLIREYRKQHPEIDYENAYRIILDSNAELKEAYAKGE